MEDANQASQLEYLPFVPLRPVNQDRDDKSDATSFYTSREVANDPLRWLYQSSRDSHRPTLEEATLDSTAVDREIPLSKSGRLSAQSPAGTAASDAPVWSQSIEPSEKPASGRSNTSLHRYNVFIRTHRSLKVTLTETTRLRRQCHELRKQSMSHAHSLSVEGLQTGTPEPTSSTDQTAFDVSELQQLERSLCKLDEKLINEISDMLQAAPRVLDRIPVLLAKHHLGFRGSSGSNSDKSPVDQDPHLDPQAQEVLSKLQEIDGLEEEILKLRSQRGGLEGDSLSRGDEDRQQDPVAIERLDREIAEAIQKLKDSKSDLENSRDMSVETGLNYLEAGLDYRETGLDDIFAETIVLNEQDAPEPMPTPVIRQEQVGMALRGGS